MKQLVGFLTIGLLMFPPVIFPEIQAQQTAAPASTATPSSAITLEELKSRRAVIESTQDIDAAAKTDSLKYIDQAITYLELANSTRQKERELSQLIQTAPERMKILQAELKKPFTVPEKVAARAQQMSTLKLEQRLTQKEAELATAQGRLGEWEDRLAAGKAIINQTSEQLATAASRLQENQAQLEPIANATEADMLSHSRMLSLKSEREALEAEIILNEQRQRSQNLLIELFSLERALAQKKVESREQMLKSWQAEVQNRRQQEAVEAREDAQDAIVKLPLMPKIVQEQFAINIELSTELEKIGLEETQLAKKYEAYQSRLNALDEEFETAKKRVESAVLTAAIGLALRQQRLNLPSADQYFADSESRQIKMSDISEKQIQLDRLSSELADPQAQTDRVMDAVSSLADVDRGALESKIQTLIANRLDILVKLKTGYDRIFKLIQDIEFTEQKLVNTAEQFGELLDRHLLWIRSSKPIQIHDLQKLKVSLNWLIKPASWLQLFEDMGRSIRQKTAVWTIGLLIGFSLIASRRWARRKLKSIAESIAQQVEDSFLLTIKALALTILLASVWPFMLAFPAVQLLRLQQDDTFRTAIASGLIGAANLLIIIALLYQICRPYGLASAHFQWPESARRTLKRNLGWLMPIIVLFSFFLRAMETVPEFEYSDALAKFSLMIIALATSLFIARILRFRGGIISVLIENYPKSWLCRLRYVWYPVAIFVPLLGIWLAAVGFYYSAMQLTVLIRNTIVLTLTLIVFNDLMLRMLMLARRRIAIKKAIANQALHLKSDSGADDEADTGGVLSPLQMEPIIALNEIDEQTRSLLKLVLFILALAGIWVIWEPVFPAFGILQDIQFWSYSTEVDGVSKTVPITLANIIMAVIVAITTIIASSNLPGLLEVILLNHLPMRPGARYAYSTVCRYAITAVGIITVFSTIGIKWSNLQWLIAALSVGLGFGLQEIVANFISGLIVLFERPYSVGDTVTVGEVHGTVTRIRIRATTIEDWDRKELIVPNKEFITGQLINWSLTDHVLRFKVPVGIAYGSDTDLAEQLLLKVAKTNPRVKKTPEPKAVFLSFGDNALNFELRVYVRGIDDWIPMLHEMNRAIDKEFRQAGITIAFPQRDVHLDAAGPLDIRVVSEPPSSGTSKRSSVAQKQADE